MIRIFIDLEMHPMGRDYKEERRFCTMETIEIGAVKMDTNYQIIDRFQEYIKPKYSTKVYAKYEKLTGITTQMLQDAPPFDVVLSDFVKWCGKHYTIYSWSTTDSIQIMKEMELKKVESSPEIEYMLEQWHDFQVEYSKLFELSKIMSLEKAVNLAGLDFEGRAHDGLVDAENTALLFKETQDSESFKRLLNVVKNAFKEEQFTMGDIFDFDNLKASLGDS